MLDKLDDTNFDLLFSIRRSVRYHMHRRRFYEAWNTYTITVALVGGSVSLVAFLGNYLHDYLPIFLAFVSLVAIIDLAFGPTVRKAGHHGELARCFIELEKIFAKGENLTKDQIEVATKQRLEIEASEPPIMRLLDVMCHYEIMKSIGHEKPLPRIPLWRRIIVHIGSQTTYARTLTAS